MAEGGITAPGGFSPEARRNLLILVLAQALGGASAPIVISLGGVVGKILAPGGALVTLPVSVYNLGLALGTIPAALIMRKLGRQTGYFVGALVSILAGMTAAGGIWLGSFALFCTGTLMAGLYASYVQSYRFAAADAVGPEARARAISWVMIGGLFAAIIGPQMVIWTRDAIHGVPYAGGFLGQAMLAVLALPVLAQLRLPRGAATPGPGAPAAPAGRPLSEIARQPRFLLAVASGVVSYGLMSFVMTAAPVAIVGCGFSVGQAALGIQWHVLAMFAPSFVTGRLVTRFGKEKVTATGLLLIAVSAIVALSGLELGHFWVSLILLGVGWNFGFIGATAMVTDCHSPEERTRVQGLNDFLVFGSTAAASFLSGTLLTAGGWALINTVVFPVVAIILMPLLWRMARGRGMRPA
ncbi:MFS transporter [Radicibacter daui]|uniref:MFS transporter n=1 Tax=Radicibacter daui TaxID=3064829 RepID=UPI004046924A